LIQKRLDRTIEVVGGCRPAANLEFNLRPDMVN
jgi:hypothetical protein